MKLKNIWCHFITITHHKWLVMKYCFAVGLYYQGMMHDLSKYSWEEFLIGASYYQGTRSPNAAERDQLGFSKAWLHHKGRNKHHFEYWIDFSNDPKEGLVGHLMPFNYVVEMVMDRIAACQVYNKEEYHSGSAWEYYAKTKDYIVIHQDTRMLLETFLWMLKQDGQTATFSYIRRELRKNHDSADR